jgi:SAM-dependent methyltransferase
VNASLPTRREILHLLAPANIFQPATMLWRVFEIEAVLRHARLSGRGVDVGCGDGELGALVFDAYAPRPRLFGIEPEERDCALARASGTYENVFCVGGDAMPIASETLDFAFSNSTLEHIVGLGPVLADVARVLRPGGEFIFTVPSEQFHECLAGSRVLGALAGRRGDTYEALIDERLAHQRYLSPDEWRTRLIAVGFRESRATRYFPRSAVRAWESLSNATGGIAYELFRGRRATRQIQHGLGLSRRGSPRVARFVAAIAERVGRLALADEVRPDEPSGGLLIVAMR